MVFDKIMILLAVLLSCIALGIAIWSMNTRNESVRVKPVADSIRLMESYYERHKDDECTYDMRHMRDILLDSLQ